MDKLDTASNNLKQCVITTDSAIKAAVKEARQDERQHYSKLVHAHKHKAQALSSKVSSLTSCMVTTELRRKKAENQMNRSTKRSDDVNKYCQSLEMRINELENTLRHENNRRLELELELDEKESIIAGLVESSPISFVGKVPRKNRSGASSSWPLFMWELMIEQIVNGTPPTSVNANIISSIKCFSPNTKIKEMPSIWTIRRARTVLLVIVQTLAAYRLARAKSWGQLHTDGTSRRQISYQDLVITMEEDVDGIFE